MDGPSYDEAYVRRASTGAHSPREGRNDPSEEEWGKIRDSFHRMYVTERMALPEIKIKMEKFFGFRATERMFKTRIEKWGFDNKTIKHVVWEEMRRLWQLGKDNGCGSFKFLVSVSGERRKITNADIQKHFKRVNVANLAVPNDRRRVELLRRANIEIIPPDPSPHSSPQRPEQLLPQSCLPHVPSTAMETEHRCSNSPPSADVIMSGEFGLHMALSLPSSQTSSPGCIINTPMTSETSRNDDCGTVEQAEHPKHPFGTMSFADIFQGTADDTGLEIYPCLPTDLASTLEQRSMKSEENKLITDRIYARLGFHYRNERRRTLDADEDLAGQWIQYYLMSCDYSSDVTQFSSFYRDGARELFTQMLKAPNRFVLPSLNYMTSTLAAVNDTMYRQFLEDCIDTIQNSRHKGVMYSLWFEYCLAFANEDQDELDRKGSQLKQAQDQLRLAYGNGSLNILICEFYLAWDQLRQRHYDDAIKMLKANLATSSRVLGQHHHLTVNALAMLSRAYDERNLGGDAEYARSLLEHAVTISPLCFGHGSPFHLKLLSKMGAMQENFGALTHAENIYREVLGGRVNILGFSNGSTWQSARDLERVLHMQGKSDDKRWISYEMEKLHECAPAQPIYESPRDLVSTFHTRLIAFTSGLLAPRY